MVVETISGSTSASTREQRKKSIKEDVKHLLGEIWNCKPDETFHKILSREAKKKIHIILHKSRAELLEIPFVEDSDDIFQPESNEVGEIRMLRHYRVHLNEK